MKTLIIYTLSIVLVATGCQKSKEHGEHEHGHDATAGDVVESSGNTELYNEVMKIHDEVMPKLDDIHKAKQLLKEKIEKTPNLSKADRIELDAMIAKLDSAGEGMMVWMREFRPIPDSLGEEKAREYLEGEMERVKTVRSNILNALEQASQKK